MLTMIFYVLGCSVIAGVLTTIFTFARPIQDRGETKSWRILGLCLLFTFAAPYVWVEALTHTVGKDMKAAVKDGFIQAGIEGPMSYYKVVSTQGTKARAIAIGEEKENWGGSDRVIVSVSVVKKGKRWEVDSYKVVHSANRNQDGFQFPPYW
jgi:hypothetical protein